MNINFSNIFELSLKQLKENWGRLFLNSLILGVLVFGLVILYLLVISILVGSALATSGVISFAFGVLAFIAFVLFIAPITFISTTTNFVVAKSGLEDNRLLETFKHVCTVGNIGVYTRKVFLPLFLVLIAFVVISAVGVAINEYFGLFLMLILLFPIAFVSIALTSVFLIALYHDVDLKVSYRDVLSKYPRKQIFSAYIVQLALMIILNLILGIVAIIPFIGFIINIVLGTVGGAVITQAMILSIGEGNAPTPSESLSEVEIKSESTVVTINSYGAQITSVVNGDVEYMWQADPQFWGRTAPVLFPFVGKLKDDKYQAGGEVIAMNQHGFLRDRDFTIVDSTPNSVTFEYTSTLADFDLYPCDFTVQISYQVVDRKVTTTYKVINNSSYEMPYQIGAHPAFNVESVDSLTAVFAPQQVTKHYFAGGLQSRTETTEIERVELSYDAINENLPCFSDFKNHTMMLQKNGIDFINFEFDSMEYLAIWSPEFKNAKFVCIEPWNGICSRQDQEGYLLENKDGINYLAAESSESCSFSFEIC